MGASPACPTIPVCHVGMAGTQPTPGCPGTAAPATAAGAVFCLRGSLSQVLPLSMPSWTDPAWKDPAGCSCVDSTGYWRPSGVTVLVHTLWPPAAPRPTIPPRIRGSCWILKGWTHMALLTWHGKVQPSLCVGAGGSLQELFSPRSWIPPGFLLDSLLN